MIYLLMFLSEKIKLKQKELNKKTKEKKEVGKQMKLIQAIHKLNGVYTCKGCILEDECTEEDKKQCGDDKIFVEGE